ncbi:RNA polymerase factor sigma-54 [Peribacillus muralis]|uniref:RNA polymerase factor sigma-54 n=1 Tax=Peribacillus muralis TaxID=264697 RepID=UPI001F4D6F84|nr:RNA polymerase factor sigma-54 [Peribacillus muralis]MCK1994399.1 RNA polymerase factor sigma-54 [Peribacillus muralis]MCK2014816.1 RNA polymerase factor sigma-54 [Peribacillus muralis]
MSMNMKAGLFQQQTLKMAMTQELMQAITLLQYSAQELSAFLESKMAENPLLSLDQPTSALFQPTFDRKRSKRTHINTYDANYWIEQISEDTVSLEQHVMSQVNHQQLTGEQQKAMLLLVHNLDENGYLRINLDDICSPGITSTALEESLSLLQKLEPHGLAARNLQECLLLQVKAEGVNPLAEVIIENHFLDFAEKRWKDLSKNISATLKEIQEVFDYVQKLNPRPASIFFQEKPSYIVPDVVVEVREGMLLVGNYDGNTPNLNVDKGYLNRMKSHADKGVQRFIQDKWQEYQWISRGIQQRKETILKVIQCIVEKQPACFHHGLNYLKPMTMKEIADEIGIHESTVSRAVKGKYVQTPFGTIEMRIFFTTSLQSVGLEEDMSGMQAKKSLKAAIDGENKQKPLSDQDLVARLKEEHGIILARRTVAKYREQLGIPSSSKRKRYD